MDNIKKVKDEEDIENLKDAWYADPCWNIEDTEGFGEHKDALLAYRAGWERTWETRALQELRAYVKYIMISDDKRLADHLHYVSGLVIKLGKTLERR